MTASKHQLYVLCDAVPKQHQYWPEVLLIEKQRPAWQEGRLNLPGGHVEEGESLHEAAARELWEETSIRCHPSDVRLMGSIEGPNWTVHVAKCEYDSFWGGNVAEAQTDEQIMWMPLQHAFRDKRLMDNLRIIIPLVRSNLIGWQMASELDSGKYLITQDFQCASLDN